MPSYKPIWWASPTHYVGHDGERLKDFYVAVSIWSLVMSFLHRNILRRRDPFFYRADYGSTLDSVSEPK